MTSQPSMPGEDSEPAESRRPLLSRGLRVAVQVVLLAVFVILLWELGSLVRSRLNGPVVPRADLPVPSPSPTTGLDLASFDLPELLPALPAGVSRLALLHTTLPERPRFELTQYTVPQGDTIFGIGDKFGLKPQTIMWGNTEVLGDDPDMIRPGLVLTILPENGALYKWNKGDGLNHVAAYFHVTPQAIVEWPGNHLSLESLGDFALPDIQPGTLLFIPGGVREYISKVVNIPRKSPGVASYLGPGVCSAAVGGSIGTGAFVWPVRGTITTQFSPDTNHPAIDIAAPLGTPVAAADTGVVVYSGPTYDNIGYGNLVIIDHGNGWQTLYAHLSEIYVSCGVGVFQGGTIGAIGSTGRSTGPHLHFQMDSTQYGKVNPLSYLP